MAKVFIGIAMLLMLATAGVAFMLKGNVDKLQSKYTETKTKIADAEGKARAAKTDAEKAQVEAKTASEKAAAAEQAAQAKGKEADDAKMQLAEAKTAVDAQAAKVKELEAKLASGTPTGVKQEDFDAVKAQLAEATTKAQNAEKERDEAKVAADAAVAAGKANADAVADLRKKFKDRESGFYKAGIQGRVLAMNSGWNFAVLSVGDKQGVMVNQTLLVVRGNQPVARLRITSVEPSTSIADVLPGTVVKGTSVQPGDTVIFEGGRTSPSQPGLPSKPTPDAPAAPVTAPLQPALPNS